MSGSSGERIEINGSSGVEAEYTVACFWAGWDKDRAIVGEEGVALWHARGVVTGRDMDMA